MEYNLLSQATKDQHEQLCLKTSLDGPITHTQTPITTGTSVIGVAYKDGIVLAADTLGSYGSLARFRNCSRVLQVNPTTMVACMGDYADFQYLKGLIEQKAIDDTCIDDGFSMSARSLHCWLTRVLYNKRSEFDPLWTTFVVGGIEAGEEQPFLGYVDKLGTSYKDPIIATGYGSMLATPLIRNEWKPDMTEAEAVDLVKRSLKLLYYRDARAFKKYELGIVSRTGARIEGPLEVDQDWTIADSVSGYE
jgi:20S proteasome subunit beta 7